MTDRTEDFRLIAAALPPPSRVSPPLSKVSLARTSPRTRCTLVLALASHRSSDDDLQTLSHVCLYTTICLFYAIMCLTLLAAYTFRCASPILVSSRLRKSYETRRRLSRKQIGFPLSGCGDSSSRHLLSVNDNDHLHLMYHSLIHRVEVFSLRVGLRCRKLACDFGVIGSSREKI